MQSDPVLPSKDSEKDLAREKFVVAVPTVLRQVLCQEGRNTLNCGWLIEPCHSQTTCHLRPFLPSSPCSPLTNNLPTTNSISLDQDTLERQKEYSDHYKIAALNQLHPFGTTDICKASAIDTSKNARTTLSPSTHQVKNQNLNCGVIPKAQLPGTTAPASLVFLEWATQVCFQCLYHRRPPPTHMQEERLAGLPEVKTSKTFQWSRGFRAQSESGVCPWSQGFLGVVWQLS